VEAQADGALVNSCCGWFRAHAELRKINEYFLEWKADRALSDALKRRCKAEGIFGSCRFWWSRSNAAVCRVRKKLPKWIGNQIDPRRGRFAR